MGCQASNLYDDIPSRNKIISKKFKTSRDKFKTPSNTPPSSSRSSPMRVSIITIEEDKEYETFDDAVFELSNN